jgi:molybdate-binding protein
MKFKGFAGLQLTIRGVPLQIVTSIKCFSASFKSANVLAVGLCGHDIIRREKLVVKSRNKIQDTEKLKRRKNLINREKGETERCLYCRQLPTIFFSSISVAIASYNSANN